MAKRVKFVLNRKNFREQILKGDGTRALLGSILGDEAHLDVTSSGERVRARVYKSIESEAKNGTLSRKLGSL